MASPVRPSTGTCYRGENRDPTAKNPCPVDVDRGWVVAILGQHTGNQAPGATPPASTPGWPGYRRCRRWGPDPGARRPQPPIRRGTKATGGESALKRREEYGPTLTLRTAESMQEPAGGSTCRDPEHARPRWLTPQVTDSQIRSAVRLVEGGKPRWAGCRRSRNVPRNAL